MSETTGSQPDNSRTTPQGTPPASAQPPASPVPASPAPPESLNVPPPSSELSGRTPDEILRDWNHTRGEIMARNTQWESWQGQMQQIERNLREENHGLQRQLQEQQGRTQELNTQLDATQQQVSQIPDLQQQAQRAERLQVILQYPSIVAQTEVRTSEGEDGQQIEERVNPFLDLLLDSNKSPDDFSRAVSELDARLRSQAQQDGETANMYDMNIRPPQPPAPTGVAGQIRDLERQRDEARNLGNYDLMRNLEDQILELQQQQRQ